jgi:transposase-like protein
MYNFSVATAFSEMDLIPRGSLNNKETKSQSNLRTMKFFTADSHGFIGRGMFGRRMERFLSGLLGAELTHHLGYAKGGSPAGAGDNCRNGTSAKMLIAVVDGLKGFPEAITGVFPQTTVQTCIVHLTRFSLAYCSWQDRAKVAGDLKAIYRAASAEEAARRLEEFAGSELGKKHPMIAASWRRHWAEVIPFYDCPPEIRKMIHTTSAIWSLNMQLRKGLKNRGHFPSEAAASKLIYLALRNIVKQWKKPPTHWGAAAHQFALKFGERFISSPSATEKR